MQFFAIIRRRTESFTDEQFAPLLDEEAARVRALYAEGSVRAAYSRVDTPGAILLLEAATEMEAKRIVDSLPFLARGMSEAQIVPVKSYRGFA
jgi:hypothetical protein